MFVILQDNIVLLFDDPFSGLDFRSSVFVTVLFAAYRR